MINNLATWWTGVVEDRDDPEGLGRCRVRIFGYHTPDTNLLPTSDLPWAIPMQSITSAATSGVGSTPVGIVPGTWVIGWFLDGGDAQQPLMIGTIAGKPAMDINATKKQEQINASSGVLTDSNNNIIYDHTGNPIKTNSLDLPINETMPPMKPVDLNTLFAALSNNVSSNNISKIGAKGELGKYQININTLIDLGYVKRQTSEDISVTILDDNTNWTGKGSFYSKDDFLKSEIGQDAVMLEAAKDNYDTLIRQGKISETDDFKIVGGLLAAAHVMGVNNADKLNKKDSNGIRGKEYFVLGNSALGGDNVDFLKSLDASGNYLPSIKTITNTGVQNNSELKDIKGFTDPNKKYPRYEYNGLPDVNKLAIGNTTHGIFSAKENKKIDKIPTAKSSQTWDEPSPAYGAGYPYNQVIETEAGHIIEIDSTPGAERLHVYHKAGTYIEVDVNGTMVRKTVGENYEIMDRNNFVYVKGAHNLTVEGTTTILIKDNATIEVEGDLSVTGHGDTLVQSSGTIGVIGDNVKISAKTGLDIVSDGAVNIQGSDINLYAKSGSITEKATGDISLQSGKSKNISIKGGLTVMIDATTIKNKMGANTIKELVLATLSPPKALTPDTTQLPVLQREVIAKSNYLFDSGELGSDNHRKALAANGIINLNMTPKAPAIQAAAENLNSSSATGNPNKVIACDCAEIQEFKYFPRSFILSNKDGRIFTLGDLLQDGGLVAQRGLTEQQIVCNLKQLVVSCLDPIKAKFPDMKINSGFRAGTNGSDHGLGAAVDIKFTNTSKSSYKDIAEWIISNVPYRQVLLEYSFDKGSTKLRSAWIHLAFLTNGGKLVKSQYAPVQTFVNHSSVYQKLVNLA
jgi:hypothetical protein